MANVPAPRVTDFEFSSAEMDGLEFSSAENELEFGAIGQSPHAELEGGDDRGAWTYSAESTRF